jgi:mRNA-degrading endonuclease toxin of MazEF toxin-antitoxin module
MTSYDFGGVVLVHFPQSGTAARKQRPGVVVLDVSDADLVIAPVTSKPRNQAGDLPLTSLTGTGLIRPSWMRLAKVATLLKTDIVRPLGRLTSADRNQLALH